MSFTSGQLAKNIGGVLKGKDNIVCYGATIDSRACNEGSVFFAFRGEHVDGHEFVQSAMQSGCSIAIVEREMEAEVPHVLVPCVRNALHKLATWRRGELPAQHVIAVTGSAGKTTVKDMLGEILGTTAVVSAKSFNNDLGVPLTILAAEEAQYVVAEIGANDVGEIEPLARLVKPNIAILTSIGQAHLEGFKDTKTVLAQKAKLLEALPSTGFAIVPEEIDLSPFAIQAQIVTVGKSDDADFIIETNVNTQGNAVLIMEGHAVTLSLLGEHNARNGALAVVACSFAQADVPLQSILSTLAQAKSAEGRLRKETINGIIFIDDSYNANPDSMRSALTLFEGLQASRKVLVLGDMLELGEQTHAAHRLLAHEITQAGADLIFLVGNEMKVTSTAVQSVHEESATDDALLRIVEFLQDGDIVLLKGSRGMQLERIIEFARQTKVSKL